MHRLAPLTKVPALQPSHLLRGLNIRSKPFSTWPTLTPHRNFYLHHHHRQHSRHRNDLIITASHCSNNHSRSYTSSNSTSTSASPSTSTNKPGVGRSTTEEHPASAKKPAVCTPPKALQQALIELHSLPELKQAVETIDASLRHTLLTRIHDILVKGGSSAAHRTVAHMLLARHYNLIGDVANERVHRVDVVSNASDLAASLSTDNDDNDDEMSTSTFTACTHAALALCCLRGHGDEMTLAATTAAMNVERYATDSQMRLCGTLLNGIAASKDSPKRRMLLTALTTIGEPQRHSSSTTEEAEDEGEDNDNESKYPDVCGYARYLLAANEHEEYTVRKDHALALVVRWDNRKRGDDITYRNDFIEALLLAGRTVLKQKDGQQSTRTALDHAEDLFGRALEEANQSSYPSDKVPVLLALAELYRQRQKPIQAEGMFRAAIDTMEPMWKRQAFTVGSAELYHRMMTEYGQFLSTWSVDGRKRTTEVDDMSKRAANLRDMYPHILGVMDANGNNNAADLWMIDSLLEYFELKLPF